MSKNPVLLLLSALLVLTLCGCGGVYDKEYVSESDYVPQVQDNSSSDGKITVRSFSGLKQAIIKLVSENSEAGTVVFDPAYDGDTAEDLDDACWQVMTRDALCVYCVEDIQYELRKIVTYYEADINISYTTAAKTAGDIEHVAYSTGAVSIIRDAISQSRTKLVILISNSAYGATDMESLVQEVYRANPATAPCEPRVNVNMYSGSGSQRLYDIRLNYLLTSDELKQRKAALDNINAFGGVDTESMTELEKAELARDYLVSHCSLAAEGQAGTVYSALVEHFADSEGIALGYVELCRQLGLDCQIVFGQRNWSDHCWNIIGIGGDYYHVDITNSIGGAGSPFLNSDAMMWELYRWDTASYPYCEGELIADKAAG